MPGNSAPVSSRRAVMFEYFLAHPPAGGWPPTLQRLMSAVLRSRPRPFAAFHER